jgi:glycopeptide antibiotics resistance protein
MAFLQKKESAGEKKLNLSNLRLYLVVILAGIAIGVFVELIQGNYIYKRYYDTEDIIVNSIGTVIGGLGYTLIGRKLV